MAKIAVEDTLSDIKQTLENNGHQVMALDNESLNSCDYCVVSGLDKNVMGIAERATKGSVINADGMTSEEVLNQIG